MINNTYFYCCAVISAPGVQQSIVCCRRGGAVDPGTQSDNYGKTPASSVVPRRRISLIRVTDADSVYVVLALYHEGFSLINICCIDIVFVHIICWDDGTWVMRCKYCISTCMSINAYIHTHK